MKSVFYKEDALYFDLKDPDREVFLWVDKNRGAKHISAGTGEVPAGSAFVYHSHDVEEMMFIYRGEGVAIVEGETFRLEPETMVFMPPGVKHQFRNTGHEPLAFAFFYAPPGPEQVYYTIDDEG
jgi:mannose-6-phosphate isomerase-like protein (cupin superfamily)